MVYAEIIPLQSSQNRARVGKTPIPGDIVADLVLLHIGTARFDEPETEERFAAVRQRCGISDIAEPDSAIAAVRRGLRGYPVLSHAARTIVQRRT